MDGLRRRAREIYDDPNIFTPRSKSYQTTDAVKYFGSETQFSTTNTPSGSLVKWAKELSLKQDKPDDSMSYLKLVAIPRPARWNIDIHKGEFRELYEEFEFDDYGLHLLHQPTVGLYILPQLRGTQAHVPPPLNFVVVSHYGQVIFWSFRPERGLTRAILFTDPGPNITFYGIMDLHRDVIGHPLYPLLVHITERVREIERLTGRSAGVVTRVGLQSGYDKRTPYDPTIANLPTANFAELSQEIGGAAFHLNSILLDASEIKSWIAKGNQALKKLLPLFSGPSDREELLRYDNELMEEVLALLDTTLESVSRLIQSYQDTAKTILTVIFNVIAREDANASIELAKDSRTIALATKYDSSSMKTIAFMTMAFLPATFFAAFFAMPFFSDQNVNNGHSGLFMERRFWIYWAVTLPSTLLVFMVWFLISKRKEIREKLEIQKGREDIVKRTNTFTTANEASGENSWDEVDEKKVPTQEEQMWPKKTTRRRKVGSR